MYYCLDRGMIGNVMDVLVSRQEDDGKCDGCISV